MVRGAAIAIVVLSHALQFHGGADGLPLLRVVYTFSMPLLMFVSGFAAGYAPKRPLFDTVKLRARSLLVPFVAWGVIYTLVDGVPASTLQGDLWSRIDGALAQGPWYLAALFVFSVLLAVLPVWQGRFVDLLKWFGVLVLLYIALRAMPDAELHVWKQLFRLLPYFLIGYLTNVNAKWRRRLSTVPIAALGVLYVIALAILWPVFDDGFVLVRIWPAHPGVRFIARYAPAVAAGLSATLLIDRGVRRIGGRIGAALAVLGTNSLGIYVIHMFVIDAWPSDGMLAVAAMTVTATAVSLLLTVVLSRVRPLRIVLFGGR